MSGRYLFDPPAPRRRQRREPSLASLTERARAMLGNRALTQIGKDQYAIQGKGRDVHGQPNVWHVDLGRVPPYCDCPAFLHSNTSPQMCKHVLFLQQVQVLLEMLRS